MALRLFIEQVSAKHNHKENNGTFEPYNRISTFSVIAMIYFHYSETFKETELSNHIQNIVATKEARKNLYTKSCQAAAKPVLVWGVT